MSLSIGALPAGIVGARFWQVFFFDGPFYSAHPGEIAALWQGGLSIQGGVVGALVAGIIYVREYRLPFRELAGLADPGLIPAQSIGRDANLFPVKLNSTPLAKSQPIVRNVDIQPPNKDDNLKPKIMYARASGAWVL